MGGVETGAGHATSVRGVSEVEPRFEVHEEAGSISSLQGEVRTRAASA